MDIKKFNEFDDELSEMAKVYPSGSFVKVVGDIDGITSTGRLNVGCGTNFAKFVSIFPSQGTDEEDGYFYMEIIGSARAFLEGKVLVWNNNMSKNPLSAGGGRTTRDSEIRISIGLASQPGIEWKYIQPNLKEIQDMRGKSFFFSGNETSLMDTVGKQKSVDRGTYYFSGNVINFQLTKVHKEPVLMLQHKDISKEIVFVKLSDVSSLKGELDEKQYEHIATWFSKQLNIKFTWDNDRKKFNVKTVWLKSNNESFADGTSSSKFGPFFTEKQAQEVLDFIEEQDQINLFKSLSVDVEESNWGITRMTFDQLIKFAKANGVEFDADTVLSGGETRVKMGRLKKGF